MVENPSKILNLKKENSVYMMIVILFTKIY